MTQRLDCGCEALLHADDSVELSYCPLHEAAPEMLGACRGFLYAVDHRYFGDDLMIGPPEDRTESAFVTGLRAAIEIVEGAPRANAEQQQLTPTAERSRYGLRSVSGVLT